jgi:hypothetical protein
MDHFSPVVLLFLHQNHNVSNQTLWCLAFMSFELAGKMRVNIENKLTGCFLLSLQKNIIMTDISLKYSLLSNSARQEVNDFMDFLLNKQKEKKAFLFPGTKRKSCQYLHGPILIFKFLRRIRSYLTHGKLINGSRYKYFYRILKGEG